MLVDEVAAVKGYVTSSIIIHEEVTSIVLSHMMLFLFTITVILAYNTSDIYVFYRSAEIT